MQTIIMTVGTSVLTNPDRGLPDDKKRPWIGKREIGDRPSALSWLSQTELELISAETNTIWRLDPKPDDHIVLLHSDTPSGLECAEVLEAFFETHLGQTHISLRKIPGINYDLDETGSALERMAHQLKDIAQDEQAHGRVVTFAATGGFKAQTMIMGIIGNTLGIPVCYVHEAYRSLIYLPYVSETGQPKPMTRRANLPKSGRPRSEVISLQAEKQGHHRPKSWKKVAKLLTEIDWVDNVYFDKNAFSAPVNWLKSAPRGTPDGRHIFWIHLRENEKSHIAVSVETTGDTPEQLEQAAIELRERLGRLL